MRIFSAICVAVSLLALPVLALAQEPTPTPQPTPTPTVVDLANGTFTFEPSISMGQVGVIVALLFVAGLSLMRLGLEVIAWLKQ